MQNLEAEPTQLVSQETKNPFLERIRWRELLAVILFVALAGLLFRSHVTGLATYIGNSDRLNSHLKVLKYHVTSLADGDLDAWNEHEMLGYDSFALPYTFPNPLTYLTSWIGSQAVYVTAGYLSVALFALGGIAAYAFLLAVTKNRLISVVGGVLYQFSELSVLKVSQNDMSYLVFVLIPVIALLIYKAERKNAPQIFFATSCLLFLLMHFAFLQKTAYALMFLGLYAGYRAWSTRDVHPAGIFFSAAAVALMAASPRIYAVGHALAEYTRVVPGADISSFDKLYEFQNIRPYEILRWFDGSIFGAYPSAAVALGNNINLSEGFLLFTAPLTPFIILGGLLRFRQRWFGAFKDRASDCAFHVWILLLGFSVIVFTPVLYMLYVLFFKIDFTHARFLVAALLPLVTLVALFLGNLQPTRSTKNPTVGLAILSFATGALLVAGMEALARIAGEAGTPVEWFFDRESPLAGLSIQIDPSSIARIAVACLVTVFLWWKIRSAAAKPLVGVFFHYVLCVALVLHTILLADLRVNGTHAMSHNDPFERGNMYIADRSEFIPPSPGQTVALHNAIDNQGYRSVLVCNTRFAGGFCAGHVPEFWQIRTVDGYYGLGVPTRIALLPWPNGISLRAIYFTSADSLPWPLLALLNVNSALLVDDYLFRNPSGAAQSGRAALGGRVIKNPYPPVPRAFFARSVRGVSSSYEAVAGLTERGAISDPAQQSFVEGLDGQRKFSDSGGITLSGKGDKLQIAVEKSPEERFLVLNELYFPGWEAWIDGQWAPIYPTNSFMRGIIVPAQATNVTLRYVPFVKTPLAQALYGAGFLLLVAGWLALRRHSRTRMLPSAK